MVLRNSLVLYIGSYLTTFKRGENMEGSTLTELVNSGIGDLITDAQGMITAVGPQLVTVAGAFIAVNLGIKLFKRFGNKIG